MPFVYFLPSDKTSRSVFIPALGCVTEQPSIAGQVTHLSRSEPSFFVILPQLRRRPFVIWQACLCRVCEQMYAPAQANVEVDDVCPVIAEWNVCCVRICTVTGQQVPQSVTGLLSVSFSRSLTSRAPAGKAAEGHTVRLTPPFKRSRYGFVRVVLRCVARSCMDLVTV